jgi:hypothetical protein
LKDKPIFSPIKLKDDENIWNKIIWILRIRVKSAEGNEKSRKQKA